MDSLPNNNTAASAAGLGNCIPEIDGKQTDTSVRPGFFIGRRIFFVCCAVCLLLGVCMAREI